MKLLHLALSVLLFSCSALANNETEKQAVQAQAQQEKKNVNQATESLPGYNPNFKTATKKIRQIWAESILYQELPFKIIAKKWLNDKKPDFRGKDKGKCILYCVWTTWCPRCREFNEKLVQYAEKFKDDLVIVAISDEDYEIVAAPFWADARDLKLKREPTIPATKFNYYVGVLPLARKPLNVTGVPHVLIIDPDNFVVWEGNPNDKEYGLTEEIIQKIIDINKAKKAENK